MTTKTNTPFYGLSDQSPKTGTESATPVTIVGVPTGVATEGTLSSLNSKTQKCDTDRVTVVSMPPVTIRSVSLAGAATESTLSSLNGKVSICDTGAVAVVGCVLPTGAATEAKQDDIISAIGAIPSAPSTVTANLGTLNGAATEAKQDDIISAIGAIPAAPTTITANLDSLNGAATEENQVSANKLLTELTEKFQTCPDCGGVLTRDVNLENVLGTTSLLNEQQRLKVDPLSLDKRVNGRVPSLVQGVFGIPCSGYACATIQLSGTWAGTITFEGSVDGGVFYTLYGVNVSAIAPCVGTTTTSGIFRFAIAGLTRIQCRFSAYTSGAPIVIASLTVQSTVMALPGDVYGSVTNALSQKASTNELNTYDTNLAATTALAPSPIALARVAPAIASATTFARPFNQPSYFQRIRTDVAGDQRLPFAQEENTNRAYISSPELCRLLESIQFQIQVLNMQMAGMPLPNDWQAYQ